MKQSWRLLSDVLEVTSSWARPINLKEALGVTSFVGIAFVGVDQWVTNVQVTAQTAVLDSKLTAAAAGLSADILVVDSKLTAAAAGLSADVKVLDAKMMTAVAGLSAEVKVVNAKVDQILERLPPKRR
ncbi:hypothetical protein GPECTOR_122g457 [Gonium pectorale]|uniref:Uncharacterized protein n=1 Tax=Gonium pectorale TaxID=33097 RepID=A0A150FYM0_GONPE|nr:hypothetical protein GPECTOR_122g457 [Gonium pectorale]|eukprot:KXZ42716.1 hypothetical protein GPECTOR_122g457 [Gonium pectorale]